MNKKSLLLLLLVLSILIVLVYSVGTDDIIDTLKDVKIEYIILGIVFFIISLFVKALRWYVLLKDAYPNLRYQTLLAPYLFGYALSASLPAKSGDLARLGVKKHYLDINIGDSAAALFCYRIADYLFVSLFIFVSFFFFLDDYIGVSEDLRSSWVGLALALILIAIISYSCYNSSKNIIKFFHPTSRFIFYTAGSPNI